MAEALGKFGDAPSPLLELNTAAFGPARNREFAGVVATREFCTWPDGVREVTIAAFNEAGTTPSLNGLAVCFDAPSDAVADAWLTHADSGAVNSQMHIVTPGEPRTFKFGGAGITRLDVIRLYGSDALGVVVEAA